MNALIEPVDEFELMVSQAKPVLKWVGGKAQLEEPILKAIDRLHPGVIANYHEPFFGGGAIFFALARRFRIRQAFLSDTNEELINFYLELQNEPERLILALRKLKKEGFTEKRYYEVRASKPRLSAGRAARFMYLNKCGFNGLWRVNKKGENNVPWGLRGRKAPPDICNEDALWSAHHALLIATISVMDYRLALAEALGVGGFVYLDSPYWPKSKTSSFTAYGKAGFNGSDQIDLEDGLRLLTISGVPALLSNSDVPATRKLYAAYKKQTLSARRSVNSDGAKRGPVSELLVESTFRK